MRFRALFILCAAILFLSGCASTRAITPHTIERSVDWAAAAEAEVVLTSFEYSPRTLRLQAGAPVRLTIRSTEGGHDFTAPDFFAAAGVALGDVERIANGQVDLAEGESITLHLIPVAGRYDLVCTHTGHALLGMRGEIIVS